MSTATLPRVPNGHRYCWQEHKGLHLHCTLPARHSGKHWHAYRRVSW